MQGKGKSSKRWEKMYRTAENAYDYEVKTLEKSLFIALHT